MSPLNLSKGRQMTTDIRRLRIYTFVDFWNFQLGLNNNSKEKFPVDWEKLPIVLLSQINKLFPKDIVSIDEIRVYISYDANNQSDKKLLNWVNTYLAFLPKYKIDVKKRHRRKKPIFCSNCKKEIKKCPYCDSPLSGTVEKGVDTSIVTDLIKLAWNDAYDVGIIISSDADYVPAANYLGEKGKKIIAAGFPPLGKELRKNCWAQIDLGKLKEEFRRH